MSLMGQQCAREGGIELRSICGHLLLLKRVLLICGKYRILVYMFHFSFVVFYFLNSISFSSTLVFIIFFLLESLIQIIIFFLVPLNLRLKCLVEIILIF